MKLLFIVIILLGGLGIASAQTTFVFPSSPTLNQVVTGPNNQQFKWDGTKWVAIAGASPTKLGTVSWLAGANPANGTILQADAARTIVSLNCIIEVANGAAATVSVVKAASGTLLSAGTVIHSGSCNANTATPGAGQPLTLTTTTMNAGDRLGLTTTGTFTNAVGSINVVVQ